MTSIKRLFWLLWNTNADEQIRIFGAWWGGSIFIMATLGLCIGKSYEMGWQFWGPVAMGTALAFWLVLPDVAKRLEKEHGRKEGCGDCDSCL